MLKGISEKSAKSKLLWIFILVIAIIISRGALCKHYSSVETYSEIIQELNDEKNTALSLTAGAAAASTIVSAMPNDLATPIANKLSDLTTPLLVITCVLYLEKFLLTPIAFLSYAWIIPIACLILGIHIWKNHEFTKQLGIRLLILGIILPQIIPTGVTVSTLVQKTYEESIEQTLAETEELAKEAEKIVEEKDKGFFENFIDKIQDEVEKYVQKVENMLTKYVDAIAVMLITTCAIPILVLLSFMWIIKTLFELDIDMGIVKTAMTPKRKKEERHEKKLRSENNLISDASTDHRNI